MSETIFPERLETPRLILRRPVADDAEPIFARYATDPDVVRYLSWTPHASVAETRAFLDSELARWRSDGDADDPGRAWTIVDRSDGGVIGMIDLHLDGFRASIGYVLARSHWGRGLMAEALVAVRDVAFALPRVQRIQIVCDVDNPASARVMEKAGFAREGVLRRYFVHPNVGDVPRDCLCYSRVRDTDPSTTPPTGDGSLPDADSESPRRTDATAASLPEIRPLNEETDLDDLKRCVVELQDAERALLPSMPAGADIRDAYTADMLDKCVRHDGRIVVAALDDEIVGFASVYARMVSDEIDDGTTPFGWIGDLVVLSRHRDRGYAERLLDAAEGFARERGVTDLRIGVLADNAVAVGLYRARGFEPLAMQLRKSPTSRRDESS